MLQIPQYLVEAPPVNGDGQPATPIGGSTLVYAARHRGVEVRGLNVVFSIAGVTRVREAVGYVAAPQGQAQSMAAE